MMEWNSNVVERSEKLRVRVSSRLRALRDELGLTIQKLADRSGVSRAMISRIERDESCPTAPVLNRLSIGLGVPLSTVLGDSSYRAPRMRERAPMATRLQQKLWIDPGNGIRRRTLTPPDAAAALGESLLPDAVASLLLTDNLLPPRAQFTFACHAPVNRQQQVWMLAGEIELRCGETLRHLRQGDCMAMLLDQPWTVRNRAQKDARFITATAPRTR